MILCRNFFLKNPLVFVRKLSSNVIREAAPVDYVGKLQEWCRIEEKNGFVVPPFKKIFPYAQKIAARDQNDEYTYLQLYLSAKKLGFQISNICGGAACMPVATISAPNILYIMIQWAIWMSGQVAMPLNGDYSVEIVRDIVKRANSKLIICTEQYEDVAKIIADELDITFCIVDHGFMMPQKLLPTNFKKLLILFGEQRVMIEGALNNDFYTEKNALLQTRLLPNGKYYGYMLTHKHIAERIKRQQFAWHFNDKDVVMPLLPHYKLHDLVNAVLCAGGSLMLPDQLSVMEMWHTMLDTQESVKHHVNFITGTPAIYDKWLEVYDNKFSKSTLMVDHIKHYCKMKLRAIVCGYGPLSYTTCTRWKEITGQPMKEHYTLSETGIVMANSVDTTDNETSCRQGIVGRLLPDIEVKLVNKNTTMSYTNMSETTNVPAFGELQLSGSGIIDQIALQWESRHIKFNDKYLITEDFALLENGMFKIIGKSQANVVHVANRYVYCPELENVLRSHPDIQQVVVGGISDPTWGQRVTAICVLKPNCKLDISNLKTFCNKFLPTYKIPSRLKIVKELPKDQICRQEIIYKYFEKKF